MQLPIKINISRCRVSRPHFTFSYFLFPHNAQPLRTAQVLKDNLPRTKHSLCQNRRRKTAAEGTYIVQDRGRKQRHSQDLVNLVVREKHRTSHQDYRKHGHHNIKRHSDLVLFYHCIISLNFFVHYRYYPISFPYS